MCIDYQPHSRKHDGEGEGEGTRAISHFCLELFNAQQLQQTFQKTCTCVCKYTRGESIGFIKLFDAGGKGGRW